MLNQLNPKIIPTITIGANDGSNNVNIWILRESNFF